MKTLLRHAHHYLKSLLGIIVMMILVGGYLLLAILHYEKLGEVNQTLLIIFSVLFPFFVFLGLFGRGVWNTKGGETENNVNMICLSKDPEEIMNQIQDKYESKIKEDLKAKTLACLKKINDAIELLRQKKDSESLIDCKKGLYWLQCVIINLSTVIDSSVNYDFDGIYGLMKKLNVMSEKRTSNGGIETEINDFSNDFEKIKKEIEEAIK